MFNKIFKNVREKRVRVHSITNYVTANDCANVILAYGALPIMADDFNEVAEITSACDSLVINMGTLNERAIRGMIIAGKKANELGHPVILDPVGIGASKFRREAGRKILAEVKIAVIKGNISEIKVIDEIFKEHEACGDKDALTIQDKRGPKCKSGKIETCENFNRITMGIDALPGDLVNEKNINETVNFLGNISRRLKSVIVVTGEIDVIVFDNKGYLIRNGVGMMSKVTGTGCMATSIIGGFCGGNKENIMEATAAAIATIGVCGELAYKKTREIDGGTGTFKVQLIDYISKMDEATLVKYIKSEEI
ncbi:MAG: hydroxyethylthiazole kinase [Clostridium sp.]|uniref:hydroxyethylthiazole kinase n=1 Tax=Clostridium sp. TaxID=1506 RepID=UPI003044C82A